MTDNLKLINGLDRALAILRSDVQSRAADETFAAHAQSAIAAVDLVLHKERKRGEHESDCGEFSVAPVRIQYRRGQRMKSPNGLSCVYVGRPTPFGNPYEVGTASTPTRADAVAAFRAMILARPSLMAEVRAKLRGRNLACWCPCDGEPCHADVLLEIANRM